MKKNGSKMVAMALAAIIAVGTSMTTVGAVSSIKSDSNQENSGISRSIDASQYDISSQSYSRILGLKGVGSKYLSSYIRKRVSVGGQTLSVNGVIINETAYIPFRAAAGAIGASYSYSSASKTATMKAAGLEMTATDGCYVTYANGRTLFSITPNVLMSDGRLYIPASIFAKAVGMSVNESDYSISISGNYKAILSADRFYRADEVLWLARIIHAESQGEPLLGQIAVGNVVMNRVKSAYYPNTIYGVIFDRKYGVQFSPILNGSIYNTPCYNSTLAAKICLEGYDISEGAFFFLEPRLSSSSWIPNSRKYLFTIGHHDFYA